jgi:hypothetical protein
MAIKQKRFNAYSEKQVSDGIQSWTERNFDNTKKPTPDDERALEAMLCAMPGPMERIDVMRSNLANLSDIDSYMQVHIDAIRKIHTQVTSPPHLFNREGLFLLDRADDHWLKISLLRHVIPTAKKGAKFSPGRQVGSGSPVRKAIRVLLKREAVKTAAEVWTALANKPPKGMCFRDAPRIGKYIETDGEPDTGYDRFANIVSEEKRRK